MNRRAAILLGFMLAATFGQPYAQSDSAAIRARAIEKCKANRGVDCTSEAGLREWIEAEREPPPGQRSAIMQRKLEAERRAQERAFQDHAAQEALRRERAKTQKLTQ